jgi:hypothetical protein
MSEQGSRKRCSPVVRTFPRAESRFSFSRRGGSRRKGHRSGERRFGADSPWRTSVPPGGAIFVCCVVLRHRIPSRAARRFFSTVCSDRLDGARDGHTESCCPETRNPGSYDDGPDINAHGHRRGLFARERQQTEIGEEAWVCRRNVLGWGVGRRRHTLLDVSGPWLATAISAVCTAALFWSLRTSDKL